MVLISCITKNTYKEVNSSRKTLAFCLRDLVQIAVDAIRCLALLAEGLPHFWRMTVEQQLELAHWCRAIAAQSKTGCQSRRLPSRQRKSGDAAASFDRHDAVQLFNRPARP